MIIPQTVLATWGLAGAVAATAGAFLAIKIVIQHAAADNSAVAQARRLRTRLTNFKHHARTLDEHSHEYAAVFSGDEWQQLTEMLNQLDSLDAEIHTLISRKQYSQAKQLLGQVYPGQEHSSQEELEALLNWEHSVHAMLKSVVHNLEVATTQTKQISQPQAPTIKSRKRQPTLVTLADLKKSLIEGGDLY